VSKSGIILRQQVGEKYSEVGENYSEAGENYSEIGENYSEIGENYSEAGESGFSCIPRCPDAGKSLSSAKKLFFIACAWKTKVFHVILRLLNKKIGINDGTLP
jgi:hypothetical protein